MAVRMCLSYRETEELVLGPHYSEGTGFEKVDYDRARDSDPANINHVDTGIWEHGRMGG
jgi:hypothetical protein